MKFIQDRFEQDIVVNGSSIHFTDAIVLPEDEYNKLGVQELEDMKQARVDNWKFNLEHPPVQKEPTKEELLEQIKQADEQVAQLQAQKVELTAKVSAIEAKPVEPKEEPIEKPLEVGKGK